MDGHTLLLDEQADFSKAVAKVLPDDIDPEVVRYWEEHPEELAKALRNVLRLPVVPTSEVNAIIRVDRSVRPSYPDWVKEILHPEFEQSGPSEFDLSKVESEHYDDQRSGGSLKGEAYYRHLETHNMLDKCLNFADLQAIKLQGLEVFRRFFKDKVLFGWQSVVWHCDIRLYVPCLFEGEDEGELVERWVWLDNPPE